MRLAEEIGGICLSSVSTCVSPVGEDFYANIDNDKKPFLKYPPVLCLLALGMHHRAGMTENDHAIGAEWEEAVRNAPSHTYNRSREGLEGLMAPTVRASRDELS